MTREELTRLLNRGESDWLEWKRDFPDGLLQRGPEHEWQEAQAKVLKPLTGVEPGRDPHRFWN
jgi:hypothetical protein